MNDLKISGLSHAIGGTGYQDYPKRCEDLRKAMIAAGPNLGLLPTATTASTTAAPPTAPTPAATPAAP